MQGGIDERPFLAAAMPCTLRKMYKRSRQLHKASSARALHWRLQRVHCRERERERTASAARGVSRHMRSGCSTGEGGATSGSGSATGVSSFSSTISGISITGGMTSSTRPAAWSSMPRMKSSGTPCRPAGRLMPCSVHCFRRVQLLSGRRCLTGKTALLSFSAVQG